METVESPPAPSQSSGVAARLIEAGWLLAVAMVPLVFDQRSWGTFTMIKVATIQGAGLLVLVGLLAQMAGFFRRSGGLRGVVRAGRVGGGVWPAVAVLLSGGLATFFSVDRGASVWGSPEFGQGWITMSTLFSLFLGLAANLRSRAQVERLVSTALGASVPMAIYALIQRAGRDPVIFDSVHPGAFSFAGQPIFLAGYLLMLIPLSVWRVWGAFEEKGPRVTLRRVLDGLVLVLLVAAFIAAEKRGPVVAAAAATAGAMVVLGAYHQRARLAVWGGILVLVAGAGLTLLALAGGSNERLRKIPVIGTLAKIVPLDQMSGDRFRDLLWAEAPKLLRAKKPFVFADGQPDPRSPVRAWIGYGPETLGGVLPQSYLMQEVPEGRTENRFHNHVWDTLQSVGVLGLGALLALYIQVFARGYRAIGLGGTGNPWVLTGLISLAAGGVGAGGAAWMYGWGYAGAGFQFGFAAGLVIAPLSRGFVARAAGRERRDRWRDYLLLALLIGVLGNWLDLAFVFPTSPTALLFWVLLGALVGLTTADERAPQAAPQAAESPTATGWLAGLLCGGMLVAMLNGLINLVSVSPLTVGAVLHASLQRMRVDEGPSYLVPLLILPVWMIVNLYFFVTLQQSRKGSPALKSLVISSMTSLVIASGYAVFRAQFIAGLGPIPPLTATAGVAIAQAEGSAMLGLCYLGLLICGAFGVAWAISRQESSEKTWIFAPFDLGIAAALIVTTGGLAWFTTARSVRLDLLGGWGRVLETSQRKLLAGEVYEHALSVEPKAFQVRLAAANALVAFAEQGTSNPEAAPEMERASLLLIEGRAYGELNSNNYHLGRLFLRWALMGKDPAQGLVRSIMAKDAFARALRFAPDSEFALVDSAILEHFMWRQEEEAAKRLARADEVTRKADEDAWGTYYTEQSFNAPEARMKEAYGRRAIAYFRRALELSADGRSKVTALRGYRILMAEGTLHRNLGEREMALACFQAALQIPVTTPKWDAHAMMAETYADLSDRGNAILHLKDALAGSPADARPSLMNLKRRLLPQKVMP